MIAQDEKALAATSLLSVKVPSEWWMKSGISVVAGRPTVNRTNLTSSPLDASDSVLESAAVVVMVYKQYRCKEELSQCNCGGNHHLLILQHNDLINKSNLLVGLCLEFQFIFLTNKFMPIGITN